MSDLGIEPNRRRGTALVALASLLSLVCVGVPLLHGIGVYLGAAGLWGVPAAWLSFYGVLAWSAMRGAFGRSFPAWKRFGPLAIQVAAFTLVWAVDLESLATRWNFRSRMPDRMEVVELVRRGELVPQQGPDQARPDVTLPRKYRVLSSGGRISVTHHEQGFSVTFYVRRVGMWPDDDYTAFIYRSASGEPTDGVEDGDRFLMVKSLAPHWFLVEHS